MRAQVYAVFATLSIGMATLNDEGVAVDRLLAHGGLFRTPGVAQQLLAATVGAPIAVERTAGEGGGWGIALLAAYLESASSQSLSEFLSAEVFRDGSVSVVEPDERDVAGFAEFLETYRAGLTLERAAVAATPDAGAA
jgi:sugar (pentulose or hexulose) kinase